MSRKWFALFCAAAVFCGCGSGGGGEPPDPIAVDLNLPAVSALPAFTGSFAASETEADALLKGALNIVAQSSNAAGFPSGGSSYSWSPSYRLRQNFSQPSGARGALYENIGPYIYDGDTSTPGFTVTGFLRGYQRGYRAGEPGDVTAGDYVEVSLRSKMAIAFEVNDSPWTIKGKYSIDDDITERVEYTSSSSFKVSGAARADGGYALSISNSSTGKGIKALITVEERGLNPVEIDLAALNNSNLIPELLKKLSDIYTRYRFSIDIYDESNTKQYSKVFTSYLDYLTYIGL
ncbi:MAG: hypothetical protein LBQ46_11905 [Treponema sp.]|nr:hypothetical protein [Treponema sp.]